MSIITLTTDLGLRDHYVASLKGQLLSQVQGCNIIDISHEVQPFNLGEAAYYINNVWQDFPEGTIHFVGVDHLPYISIGSEEAAEIVRIHDFSAKASLRFPTRNIYIPVIIALCEGKKLSEIGEPYPNIRKAFTQQPIVEENLIKGAVIHKDKYGNVMINISEKLFNEVGKASPFTIYFKSNSYHIDKISSNYYDVPPGEKLALFNDNGYLEIAINKGVKGSGGGAASLLGLDVKDLIRVEFHPKGSKDNIEALFPD